MTPEIICSIVFGIAATILALLGIIQSFLPRSTREIDIEDQRYWYGQAPPLIHRRDVKQIGIHRWHVRQIQDLAQTTPK